MPMAFATADHRRDFRRERDPALELDDPPVTSGRHQGRRS
jgi:hypothetical protein